MHKRFIDIKSAFENEPPELSFIWAGFLMGTVGALVGAGSAGKSYWALEAAMAVAGKTPNGDLLDLHPQIHGKVVYFAGEDPDSIIIRRINAIGKYINSKIEQDLIAKNLFIDAVVGRRMDIMNKAWLKEIMLCCDGAKLIIFDTLTRMHVLDENNNGQMSGLIGILEQIAKETGAAVLFLHHVGKAAGMNGMADQQGAARGASALIDNARWCGFLMKMTENESEKLKNYDGELVGTRRKSFVRYGISKQNYDAEIIDQWYERRTGGVLIPVDLVETERKRAKREKGNGSEIEEYRNYGDRENCGDDYRNKI